MSGRTWAELSGGLDSSSIVCAASRAGAQDLEAVSIVYSRSRTANEEYWMREVISHTGVGWRTIDGDETTPFSMLPDQMLDCPTTTAVNWRLFKKYQSLLRENAVHTLLSGYGGDQTLYGECNRPLDLADLLRSARIRAALSDIDRWSAVGTTRPKTHTLFYDGAVPLYRYLRGFRISSAPSQAVTAPWLREEFVRSMPLLRRPARAAKPRMHSVASQRFWESTDHVALVAPQMWNQVYDGFELRFPLLSRPLIEYMFQLPADLTAVPEGDRVLQRSALRGLLPEAVRVRTTKGGPDEAFFAGLRRNPEMVELLTDDPLVVQRGYVSSTAWREAVRAARYGRITWTRPFIATASLEMWLHQRAASPPGQPRATAPVGIE
jgi:asparagine synthase (glutamine-hydrolysing)